MRKNDTAEKWVAGKIGWRAKAKNLHLTSEVIFYPKEKHAV